MKRVRFHPVVAGLMAGAVVIWVSCEKSTSAPTPTPSVDVTPDSIALTVGQTGQLSAQAANAANPVIGWNSSNTTIATVDNNGLVTGRVAGTTFVSAFLSAQPAVRDSARVRVNAAAVLLRRDSVRSGGSRVTNDTVRGAVTIHFTVDNIPAGLTAQVQFRVDSGAYETVSTVMGSGVLALNSLEPVEIVCSINTADFIASTGAPRFANGPHTIDARVIQPSGNVIATSTSQLVFNNQNLITMSVNGSQNAQIWRGNDMTVTVVPVDFTSSSSGHTVSLVTTPVSGTGNVVFNQTQPTAPATFTVNPTASANTEGIFAFNALVFDALGNSRTASFTQSPLQVRFDNLAPRITNNVLPANQLAAEPFGLRLNHAAGPYAVNTVLPLNRINGLADIGPHAPNCPRHGHGNITILNGVAQGPFTDPEFTVGDPCGWGPIGNFVTPFLILNSAGSVTDLNLTTATLQVVRAVGTCDGGLSLVDDVPIIQGNAIGQSPTPTVNLLQSAANFNVGIRINSDLSLVGTTFCSRVVLQDNTFSGSGVQTPNTTVQVTSTTVTRN